MINTSTIKLKREDNFMISIRLLKIIGLYQTSKSHDFKVFKSISVFQFVWLCICEFEIVINMCYSFYDVNNMTHYLILFFGNLLVILKMYCIINNAEKIWNCIKSTSINYLFYNYHDRQILYEGRKRAESFGIVIMIIWLTVLLSWLMSPFIAQGAYVDIVIKNETKHYRYNVQNLPLPATEQFYNDKFLYFYIVEMIFAIVWSYCTWLFDFFILSMCITITYQLKTIADSYGNFSVVHNSLISKYMLHNKLYFH